MKSLFCWDLHWFIDMALIRHLVKIFQNWINRRLLQKMILRHCIKFYCKRFYSAIVFLRRLSQLEHMATKFQRRSPCFRGHVFNGATSSIARRRYPSEIQDAVAKIKCTYLRLYGWCQTISNTQLAHIISVHELNENKNDNIWNMSTPFR